MPNSKPSHETRKTGGDETVRNGRLTEDMRAEILKRLKAGERAATLAREFGVTRQAVSLLKIKTATAKSRPRLVEKEVEKLRTLAETTLPSDHGFEAPGSWNDRWTGVSLHRLAEKMAKRRIMVLPIRRYFHEWFAGTGGSPVGSYDPDRPESLTGIPRDLRDPDFLQFLRERKTGAAKLPPANKPAKEKAPMPARKKRGRPGSADSLMPPPEAWEFLNPATVDALAGSGHNPPLAGPPLQPIVRTGKHRKSKGSPFTAARKKKKKR